MAIVRQITECACETCKAMCRRSPCFPVPEDVAMLIACGYKDRLAISAYPDTLHGQPLIWPLIAPLATNWSHGQQCNFFTLDGKCELHEKGLKPLEGKLAIHDKIDEGLRRAVCAKWVSPLGIQVMKVFKHSDGEVRTLELLLKNRK